MITQNLYTGGCGGVIAPNEKAMKRMSKTNNDIIADVSGSLLIADYNRLKILPTIDELLDFRNRLEELIETNNKYPKEWYEREIRAADYLLSKYSR